MDLNIVKRNLCVLTDLEPGDVVEFKSERYFHFAVYIGSKKVIHLVGEQQNGDRGTPRHLYSVQGGHPAPACIKESNFWVVAAHYTANKNNCLDKTLNALSSAQIVERARLKLGGVNSSPVFSTCVHFAIWCRYNTDTGTKQQVITELNRIIMKREKEGILVHTKLHSDSQLEIGINSDNQQLDIAQVTDNLSEVSKSSDKHQSVTAQRTSNQLPDCAPSTSSRKRDTVHRTYNQRPDTKDPGDDHRLDKGQKKDDQQALNKINAVSHQMKQAAQVGEEVRVDFAGAKLLCGAVFVLCVAAFFYVL